MFYPALRRCLLLLVTAAIVYSPCAAQVEALDTPAIAMLRNTTTAFIIPQSDSVLCHAYEQGINSAWSLTPHIIITQDQLADYVDKPGYSFFAEICMGKLPQNKSAFTMPVGGGPGVALAGGIIGGIVTNLANQAVWFTQTKEGRLLGVPKGYYSIYTLFIPKKDDKGRFLQMYAMIKKGIGKGDATYTEAFENLQKKSERHGGDTLRPDPYWNFYWNPGLLKTYLLQVGNSLATTSCLHPYTDTIDTAAIARLRTDTLYIPDYFRPGILPATDRPEDSAQTAADFARVYPYPARFVSQQQLSELIMAPGSDVNFITYSVYNDFERLYDPEKKRQLGAPVSKGVKIYNSRQGVIYSRFTKFTDGHPKLKGIKHQSARHPFTLYDMNILAETLGRSEWEQ